MPSIRLFLTLTILAIITLVNFLASLSGYRESMRAAETLFNEQLLEYALLISATLSSAEDSTISAQTTFQSFDPRIDNDPDFQSTLVFQVFNDEGNLLVAFNTGSRNPIASFSPGYSDVNFEGYRWHTLTYRDRVRQRWIFTAQRYDIRFTLAERVILESVLPIVISIPIAGLMVWLLISFGLRPITRLANELKRKEATDLSPVSLDGSPSELQPLQDSTNELLERLRASFEREKRFAADAAHELRTPIAVLKVQIHNLLDELGSAPQSAIQLKAGIDRMGHLVEQILDLNRTSPDLYMAQFELLDLYELCQEAVAETYSQFMSKDQQIALYGHQELVRGDRFALAMLLKNLLGNASKYTQNQGQVEVRLTSDRDQVILQVIDNGPGIPADERERVLERFYRTGGDRHDSQTPGCGLGLAIVDHIVALHKATMALGQPETGRGLCVTIRFNRPGKDS